MIIYDLAKFLSFLTRQHLGQHVTVCQQFIINLKVGSTSHTYSLILRRATKHFDGNSAVFGVIFEQKTGSVSRCKSTLK